MSFALQLTSVFFGPSTDGDLYGQLSYETRQIDPDNIIVEGDYVAEQTMGPTNGGWSFTSSSTPQPPDRGVGLRIKRSANAPGALFRSGHVDSLPASASGTVTVELVGAPWVALTYADLPASFGTPFTLATRTGEPSVTVTMINLGLQEGSLRVSAEGTYPTPVLGLVAWRFAGNLTLAPSLALTRANPQNLFEVSIGQPSLQLTSAGPSPAEAAVIFALLGPVLARGVAAQVGVYLAPLITKKAIAEVGKKLGRKETDPIPSTVVLSAERVIIGTFTPDSSKTPAVLGIHVLAGVGAFDGVVAKLFPQESRPGCAPASIALVGSAVGLSMLWYFGARQARR